MRVNCRRKQGRYSSVLENAMDLPFACPRDTARVAYAHILRIYGLPAGMSLIRSFVVLNRRICQALAERFPRIVNQENYHHMIRNRIAADLPDTPGDVLEVGGIDRPLLTKNSGFTYDGMDIEEKEECLRIYDHFIVQSIEEPIERRYGMIVSMTLLEHVRDNRASIRNIFDALIPGGTTHHYAPSAHHPYSLCLRAVGPSLQKTLIRLLRPAAVGETGYPAFFDHCSVKRMRELFVESGFQEIDVVAFYDANDYFAFFVPAWIAVVFFELACKRLGWSYFASGFVISARKP